MRYIRTEDGKIWSFSNSNNGFLYEGSSTKNGKWVHEIGEIFKEADEIEDLCDGFVLVDRDDEGPIEQELIGKRYRAMLDELRFRISTGCDPSKMDFYGAIWTDKGLIYVARFDWDVRGLVLLESHP